MNTQKTNNYLQLRFALSFLSLLMILIFNYSCKKPTDEVAPVITFTSPQTGSEFEIYDTILVKAVVTDNEKITYISVSLTDGENNILFSQEAYYEDKTRIEPDMNLIIDNNQLLSGTYYIRIIASDGTNIIDNFREIQIYELEREFKYPVIITLGDAGKSNAYAYKNQSWDLIQAFESSVEHSDISSAYKQLYITGPNAVGLKAIDLTDNKIAWQAVNQQHITGKWFTGIDFQYPNIFISTVDGNIRALDKTGNNKQLKVCNSGTYASYIQSGDNKVFATSTLTYPETYYVSAYYSGNSTPFVTTPVSEKPVAFKYLSDNKLLVCTNNNDKGTLWMFNSANSVISKLRSLDEAIADVTQISSEVLLVSTNKNVYSYGIQANSLVNIFTSPITASMTLAYNSVDQQVYVGVDNKIYIINFPESTVAGQITAPEDVTRILLLYNK